MMRRPLPYWVTALGGATVAVAVVAAILLAFPGHGYTRRHQIGLYLSMAALGAVGGFDFERAARGLFAPFHLFTGIVLNGVLGAILGMIVGVAYQTLIQHHSPRPGYTWEFWGAVAAAVITIAFHIRGFVQRRRRQEPSDNRGLW